MRLDTFYAEPVIMVSLEGGLCPVVDICELIMIIAYFQNTISSINSDISLTPSNCTYYVNLKQTKQKLAILVPP